MPSARIGLDGRFINDRYHGIGRYAFHLFKALAQALPEAEFVLYRGRLPDSRFAWDELAALRNVVVRPVAWPLYYPFEQLAWPAIIRRDRLDVFHSPYFSGPLLSKTPFLITVHDLIFDRYPEYMPVGWARPYYRWLMRQGTRRASQVIAVSQATARDLESYYPESRGKIIVSSEGVAEAFCQAQLHDEEPGLSDKYGLSNPYLLTVGARRPHKNLVALISAYHTIAWNIPHDLVIAGQPDRRFSDHAPVLARELGIEPRVRFLDWVPEADLPGLYRLADLVVLPSLIEGFGLPALEAMACGAPVLAANNTSFPEVVGEAGVLFAPGDVSDLAQKIKSLVLERDRRQRLARAGVARSGQFTWEKAAQNVVAAYEQVLK